MERTFKIQFLVVIFIMSIIGISSVFFLWDAHDTSKNLYEHPYTVSNTLKKIANTTHEMRSIVREGETGLELRIMNQHDAIIKEGLSLVSARYLGPSSDVKSLHSLYEKWVATEIYDTSKNHNGTAHTDLQKTIQSMSDFADDKAKSLYIKGKNDTINYAVTILASLVMAILLSSLLLIRTLKGIKTTQANRQQYLNLIDQNIMIAAVSKEGTVFDASNALCRFIVKSKNELVAKQLKEVFFLHSDSLFDQMWQTVGSGASWSGEIQLENEELEAYWLGLDIHPMQDENFKNSGYRVLANDITHRKSLEQISIQDHLTGLLNRRTLEDTLERQVKLAMRNKLPIKIGIIDIDFFKQYNDTYGHPAGDKVLVAVSNVLTRMFRRPNDFIFRIGGEEFCFISDCPPDISTTTYLEKVRQNIELLAIPHEKSEIADGVTISIGTIYFDGDVMADGESLLSIADENLYKAKEKRNTLVLTNYSGETEGII